MTDIENLPNTQGVLPFRQEPGATSSPRREEHPHGAHWAGQWIEDEIAKAARMDARHERKTT